MRCSISACFHPFARRSSVCLVHTNGSISFILAVASIDAVETAVSHATVSRILQHAGLSRLKDIEPAEPVVRSEYAGPGGLVHLDIKRLGRFDRVGLRITADRNGQSNSRGVGWEYVHVSIDEPRALPSPTSFPTRRPSAPLPFSRRRSPTNKRLGLIVTRVMTDNGSCYKARDFA